jgi:hypothetical protein
VFLVRISPDCRGWLSVVIYAALGIAVFLLCAWLGGWGSAGTGRRAGRAAVAFGMIRSCPT